MSGSRPPGLFVAGSAVIITGDMLRTMLGAMQLAAKSRTVDGWRPSVSYGELEQAFSDAMSANGQTDIVQCPEVEHGANKLTTQEVAEMLEVSERHARRQAPLLGGRRVGGQWLFDEESVREHLDGRD